MKTYVNCSSQKSNFYLFFDCYCEESKAFFPFIVKLKSMLYNKVWISLLFIRGWSIIFLLWSSQFSPTKERFIEPKKGLSIIWCIFGGKIKGRSKRLTWWTKKKRIIIGRVFGFMYMHIDKNIVDILYWKERRITLLQQIQNNQIH